MNTLEFFRVDHPFYFLAAYFAMIATPMVLLLSLAQKKSSKTNNILVISIAILNVCLIFSTAGMYGDYKISASKKMRKHVGIYDVWLYSSDDYGATVYITIPSQKKETTSFRDLSGLHTKTETVAYDKEFGSISCSINKKDVLPSKCWEKINQMTINDLLTSSNKYPETSITN